MPEKAQCPLRRDGLAIELEITVAVHEEIDQNRIAAKEVRPFVKDQAVDRGDVALLSQEIPVDLKLNSIRAV